MFFTTSLHAGVFSDPREIVRALSAVCAADVPLLSLEFHSKLAWRLRL